MNHEMQSAHALVTGGSQGLGLEIVRALRGRGLAVTAVARDPAHLSAAAELGAETLAGDAADVGFMHEAIATRRPRVLVLNAGAMPPMQPLDELSWDAFSCHWNTDVQAGFHGVQAALRAPLPAGSRVLLMSSGAATVLSNPQVRPEALWRSGGYTGAKRMLWFMAHSANAVARRRGLDILFQALVPLQVIAATAMGAQVAQAHRLDDAPGAPSRYGEPLMPRQVGEQVLEILEQPRYLDGVAWGFRARSPIVALDVAAA